MRKLTYLLGLTLFLGIWQQLQAQTKLESECAADQLWQKKLQNSRQLNDHNNKLENFIYEKTNRQNTKSAVNPKNNTNGDVCTIPLVVHLVHESATPIGTAENLSDTQVQNLISQINDDFRHTSGLTFSNAFSGFDTEIEYCLAVRDPDGNATTGIIRHPNDTLSTIDFTTYNDEIPALYNWNTTDYYNIYIIKTITGSVAGFAYFASAHGTFYDGAVMEYTVGSGVWSHELGHSLNLYHIFQPNDGSTNNCPANNNCLLDNDRVCDTPPTAAYGCTTENSCGTDPDDTSINNPYRPVANGGLGDVNDIKENYMNYYNAACREAFTEGQSVRMNLALTGTRSSYLSSPACTPLTNVDASISFFTSGTVCTPNINPVATLRNLGSDTLLTVDIELYIDNVLISTTSWTGSLLTNQLEEVTLPSASTTFGTHTICIKTNNPNAQTDEYPTNDEFCKDITIEQPSFIASELSCNYTTFNLSGTNSSGYEDPGCANFLGEDVWFKTNVPPSGNVAVTASVIDFIDGAMAIYSGSCGNLQLEACDDDSGTTYDYMPYIALNGLTPNDTLYIRFWAYGNSGVGDFGLCVFDTGYCSSNGNTTSYEWLDSLSVGSFENFSDNNSGYADFTNLNIDLNAGQSYPISITPAFSGAAYVEQFKAWIDFNNDQAFDNTTEVVFAASGSTTVSGNINIPSNAAPLTTRMRVSMKWSAAPTPCESFSYGEVEDYTVTILPPLTCIADTLDTQIYNSGTNTSIQVADSLISTASVAAGDTLYYSAENYISLQPDFIANEGCDFLAQIADCVAAQAVNENVAIAYKENSLIENAIPTNTLSIVPNPSENEFFIRSNMGGTVQIFSLQGKMMYHNTINAQQNLLVQTNNWQGGIYWVQIIDEKGNNEIQKIVLLR
ncbi:MAG: GEVED domain-containing protein [Chitinophagales bacterium]|nr:zinc-dependent metalloprotease [Bacteroidota bacterium]